MYTGEIGAGVLIHMCTLVCTNDCFYYLESHVRPTICASETESLVAEECPMSHLELNRIEQRQCCRARLITREAHA